jgi:hypothetical protein
LIRRGDLHSFCVAVVGDLQVPLELTARSTACARAGSRWIQDPRCGCGVLLKEPLSKFVLACRSSHLLRSLQICPGFCSLAPVQPRAF